MKNQNDATEKTVTPSEKAMTARQIDKAVANYRAMLEKHAGSFESNAVQTVLGQFELANEQFNVFRTRVEAISGMIIRKVLINRNLSPKQVINAAGRKQYVNDSVLAEAPRAKHEEVEVCFFKASREINDSDLEKEYELRDLDPADLDSISKVNEDDPSFADTHPNGTHWKNSKGKWCGACFDGWGGGRDVNVNQSDDDWDGRWWFAGVRKNQNS